LTSKNWQLSSSIARWHLQLPVYSPARLTQDGSQARWERCIWHWLGGRVDDFPFLLHRLLGQSLQARCRHLISQIYFTPTPTITASMRSLGPSSWPTSTRTCREVGNRSKGPHPWVPVLASQGSPHDGCCLQGSKTRDPTPTPRSASPLLRLVRSP
jgi:hypothetical protein